MTENKDNACNSFSGRKLIKLAALVLLMTGMLILSGKTTVKAEETQPAMVRIGYYPVPDYQEQDVDGNYRGFGYDYLIQIQKYTHWNYEFVEASYAECLQMLLNGEIDVMGGIVKTPARAEQMLFTTTSNSSTQNKLYARADEELYYLDYEAFNGCKVAMLKGTLREDFDQYCKDHHFSVEIVEYDTFADMENALFSKEVDMIFGTSVSDNINTKIVARLTKIPLYYAINQNKPELADELETALEKIIDNNPNFYTQMSEKYMVNGANATATFSKEELQFIQSGQEVYVIMNKNWPPISWYDTETDSYRGIIPDVLEDVKEYSGLNFVYCTEDEFNQLAAKDPDVINRVLAILADDNAWANSQEVMMTNHIVDSSVVMVTKRSTHQAELPADATIALPNRFYISWCMRNDFTSDQVLYYDTVKECLDAINREEADATYVNELVATYYLSTLEYSNLFATANSGYNENLAFSVYRDTNTPLLGILDKSLMCISTDQTDEIVIKNSIADQTITLRGLYYSRPTLVVISIILFVLILVGIGLTIYRILVKRRQLDLELAREQDTINARTEFFMMISHEIRTPLNAIVGYLDFAEEECKKQKVDPEYVKRSRAAATQLSVIAEEMLDYTQIASDTTLLKEEFFDMKEVIRDVVRNTELDAVKKGIEFQFTITDMDHEFVVGDKLRISQMMQNLLSNAVKFTDPGGYVTANAMQVMGSDGALTLTFSVQDTGKGMTAEFMEKVCTPFHQGDRAYSRTHGGLGFGLYLTKCYLEMMKGTMELTSKVGEGSCFTIHIPLKHADSEELIRHDINFAHVRGIVCGEQESENEKLKELLKRLKLKTDLCTDSEKLLKRIRSRIGGDYAYSLCILDENILEKDRTLIDEIARLEQPPIVFIMTGRAECVEELSGNQGISKVLYKPVFQSVLFDAVMNTFGCYEPEETEADGKSFRGIKVLIAEDNRINADILTKVLNKADMEFTVCENGQLVVDTFEKAPEDTYQIILMDIQMPVMDGLAAARAIRSSSVEQGRTIPIVAVSANAFAEDVEKSLQAGMNAHLSKPIHTKELYQTIEKYVQKEKNHE